MVQNATFLLIVMTVALIAFMIQGYVTGRKASNTSAEYMAAGGNMPFLPTCATVLATFICGGTVLGGAGVAFMDGMQATIPDPFAACLCLIAGGFLFQGIIRKTGALSAASVYSDRYGQVGGLVSGVCTIFPMLFFAGAQIAAIGKLFQIVLNTSFMPIALAAGVFITIYTVMGGITAVAWTDFIQISLLVLGVVVLFPITLTKLNELGGHAYAVELMGENFFNFGIQGDWTFTGIMTYLALWIGASAGAMPGADIIQRSLVARTPRDARWAAVVAGVIMTGIGLLVVFIGGWGNVFMEQGMFTAQETAMIMSDSELLVPILSTHLLPDWFVAIFFLGLLGAIISSADSAIFAPATVISNDIIRFVAEKRNGGKPVEDKKLTNWTRYAVIGLGIVATLFGTFTQSVFTLMVIGFTIQISLFFPLLLALYWKRANAWGGVAGMASGLLTCAILMISQGTIDYDPYWVLVFAPLAVTLVVQVAVSLATAKKCPPVPLTHRDGSIVKWPELAMNSFKHNADLAK